MGICGYLKKPFAMYDLMKLINNYVPIVGRDEVSSAHPDWLRWKWPFVAYPILNNDPVLQSSRDRTF